MILVTATHRQGIELAEAVTFAIDPEKIVGLRDRGTATEIEYAETYDRKRQPITYIIDAARAAVEALIQGDYVGKETLTLTVYNTVDGSTGTIDLQEKYIVDIRSVTHYINKTLTACRRVEYTPGAFNPIVIYVSEDIATLVTDTP